MSALIKVSCFYYLFTSVIPAEVPVFLRAPVFTWFLAERSRMSVGTED